MKVLWVTNTIFPDLSFKLGEQTPPSGGWMYGLAKALVHKNFELIVVTTRPKIQPYHTNINGIEYYLLSGKTSSFYYDNSLEEQWKSVICQTSPDIVHIHGTEYAHGLSLIKACPNLSYVVSIQGLISVCSRYYESGISYEDAKKHTTLIDLIKSNSILKTKKEFYKRGQLTEKKYFQSIKNFIGRTQWDYNHTKSLNQNINYYFCNESLRDGFYSSHKWNIHHKKEHTIFLSQAGYPLKGFHQVIKAVALLKDEFPQIKIRIAGYDILKSDTFKDKMKLSGYSKYILKLLETFDLFGNIEFVGLLDEEKMVREYLNCHVFICPSSIENSPNSLGEAQLLGVPCIASYVGGVPDMVEHGKTGLLYRFEEIEMMSQHIRTIFTNYELTKKISLGGIAEATKRHNRVENLNRIRSIYAEIIAQ